MTSCDTRCTSGQEGSCVCSCGGQNHGCAKEAYKILKSGGIVEVKGAGLNLEIQEALNGKVEVHNQAGFVVQTYKSEKEFVKDLGKLIVAGQVDVRAVDDESKLRIDLKGVQGRDPEAGKARLEKMREPTVSEAFDQIRATGAKVTRKDGEFRVNVPGGTEGTAYYTSDAKDAIETAKSIMKQYSSNESKKQWVISNRVTGRDYGPYPTKASAEGARTDFEDLVEEYDPKYHDHLYEP